MHSTSERHRITVQTNAVPRLQSMVVCVCFRQGEESAYGDQNDRRVGFSQYHFAKRGPRLEVEYLTFENVNEPNIVTKL